jgi:HEAT repeats
MFDFLTTYGIVESCKKTLVESSDPVQRRVALLALTFFVKSDDDDDDDFEDYADADSMDKDINSAQEVTDAVMHAIITALKEDRDPDVRKHAVWALRYLGNSQTNILMHALRDENHLVRIEAVENLGRISNYQGTNEAVVALLKALGDDDMEVRFSAVSKLVGPRQKFVNDEIKKILEQDGNHNKTTLNE